MAVYLIYIIDLTMSKQVRLCLLNTPYSYGISWGISCGLHSATLRCLLNFVTQMFSSMIIIIDSWFSCYKWFPTSRWNSLNTFKCFQTPFSSSGYIHIYIDLIHQSKFYEVEESTAHDSRSMDYIHRHVWFPVSKSHVQLLAYERI